VSRREAVSLKGLQDRVVIVTGAVFPIDGGETA
jgi:hypothetical protein